MTDLPLTDKKEDLRRILQSFENKVIGYLGLCFLLTLLGYRLAIGPLSTESVLLGLLVMFAAPVALALDLGIPAYRSWKWKWGVIEEPRRRTYAYLTRSQATLYSTLRVNQKERNERLQFLKKELAALTTEEKEVESRSLKEEDEEDKKRVWPREHLSHVMAEFTDAKRLITEELAAFEKLSRAIEVPRASVAPAPVTVGELAEETGLERY